MLRLTLLLITLLLSTASAAEEQIGCPSIVSQSPYITRTLQWLGLEHCIVGTSRYDKLGLPQTGGVMDPDGAAISGLSPDLWLISDWTDLEQARLIAPEATRVIPLHGFQSMAQIEDNLRRIGEAVGMESSGQRAGTFARQWREKAARINGQGRKTLVLTACSGTPYSFGRDTWLNGLFTAAGFEMVDPRNGSNPVGPGRKYRTLDELVAETGAELLFTFSRGGKQCPYIKSKRRVRIVSLDGDKFLHPAPGLLAGLDELSRRRDEWQRPASARMMRN